MSKVILQLTGMHSTKFGGIERYFLEVARQCADRGYKTFVQYDTEPVSQEYRRRLQESGATLIIEPRPRGVYAAFRSLWKLVRDLRPEVIHTHFYPVHYLPFVPKISRLLGVRREIAMVHNAMISRKPFVTAMQYSGYDYVLGVSEAVTTELHLAGLSGNHVRTHYMGLMDVPQFSQIDRNRLRESLGIPDDAVVFGNIAFDAPFKGVDLLLDAFKEIVPVHPAAHLVQLGVDKTACALANTSSGVRNVHWLGIRDDARAYLPAVDVYVQPSRFGEGLPLAIMEAMALERPVVATRVAGNSEAVRHGETGLLVEPKSAVALAEGMSEMGFVLTSDDRCRFGKAGYRRFCELFDGRSSVEALCELYECEG